MINIFRQVYLSDMIDAITAFLKCDISKNKIANIIGFNTSKYEMNNICSPEFHGITRFNSMMYTVYINRDKPIMITKSGNKEGENMKVFIM